MIAYRKQGKFIYLAEDRNAITHFVPTINWELYLMIRLNIPRLCKIFDTVEDATLAAEESVIA